MSQIDPNIDPNNYIKPKAQWNGSPAWTAVKGSKSPITQHKTVAELENDVIRLTYALGSATGAVAKHKLDIEDEAYEELMNELLEISENALKYL